MPALRPKAFSASPLKVYAPVTSQQRPSINSDMVEQKDATSISKQPGIRVLCAIAHGSTSMPAPMMLFARLKIDDITVALGLSSAAGCGRSAVGSAS